MIIRRDSGQRLRTHYRQESYAEKDLEEEDHRRSSVRSGLAAGHESNVAVNMKQNEGPTEDLINKPRLPYRSTVYEEGFSTELLSL